MTLEEQQNIPLQITICYPNKLLNYIEKNKPTTLKEIARTGMVIGIQGYYDPNFDPVEHIFSNLKSNEKMLYIIDIQEIENTFTRTVDIIQNTGQYSISQLINLLQYVSFHVGLVSPYMNKEHTLGALYANKIPLKCIDENENRLAFFWVISTHKELTAEHQMKVFFDTWRNKTIQKSSKKKTYNYRRVIKVSRGVRHEVFIRGNYRCKECGKTNKETILEVDHIIPVSKGGTDELSNLQILCIQCNREKNHHIWKNTNIEENV